LHFPLEQMENRTYGNLLKKVKSTHSNNKVLITKLIGPPNRAVKIRIIRVSCSIGTNGKWNIWSFCKKVESTHPRIKALTSKLIGLSGRARKRSGNHVSFSIETNGKWNVRKFFKKV